MTPDSALVVARALVYADLLALFGLSLFGLYGLGTPEEAIEAVRLRFRACLLAILGLAASWMHITTMAATMTGAESLAVTGAAVASLITSNGIGLAWLVRMAALVLALSAALALPSRPRFTLGLIAGCSAVALATLAWAGHGATGSERAGRLHLVADILHLLAAGGWLGALMSLLILLFDLPIGTDRARILRLGRALRNFSSMGTVLVVTILVTGIVNVGSVVGWGHVGGLPQSVYGQLLIAKVGLFLFMLGLASANRFWLTPALSRARNDGDMQRPLRGLRFSVAFETMAALLVLVLVAALGMLAPPRW
jgi:putative copper resistance protein D